MKAKHTRIEKRVFYALLRNCIVLNVKTLEYFSHQNKHFFYAKAKHTRIEKRVFYVLLRNCMSYFCLTSHNRFYKLFSGKLRFLLPDSYE